MPGKPTNDREPWIPGPPEGRSLVTVRVAAKVLGCGEKLVRRLLSDGELHGVRLGRRTVRVAWQSLLKLVLRPMPACTYNTPMNPQPVKTPANAARL